MNTQLVCKPKKNETILTQFTEEGREKIIEGDKPKNKYYGQYTQVPFGLFRDIELYNKLHKCLSIYMYLQNCVYRRSHNKDKFDLHSRYYTKGIIAVSVTKSEIAKTHNGMNVKTVTKRLDLLEKHGFIEIEKIKTKYKKKGKWINGEQNVYILGTHEGDIPKYSAGEVDFCEGTVDES